MTTVAVKDAGPIKDLAFEMNEPGVYVARGFKGTGKSSLIAAVEDVLGGSKCGLTNRDRTTLGRVEAAGVTMTINRSGTRRKGEVEVVSLAGKFDVAELVEPPYKDAEAADRHRIKALVALTGVAADVALFYELAGGQAPFEALTSPSTRNAKDLVEMAAKVRSDFQQAALAIEREAQTARGKAAAEKSAAGDVDIAAECDQDKLLEALQEADRGESALLERKRGALSASERARAAQASLDEAAAAYKGPTVQEAAAAVDAAGETLDAAKAEVARLKQELDRAVQVAEERRREYDRVVAVRAEAVRHENLVAACRNTIEQSAGAAAPGDDELQAAAQARTAAKEALHAGSRIRDARLALARSEAHEQEAAEKEKRAKALRDAAGMTDDVLSKAIDTPHVKIDGGRVVVDHPGRGETFFDELSHGERYQVAFRIAADRLLRESGGEGSLLPLPQEAWEGIDYPLRVEIARMAAEMGLHVLTAQCDINPEDPGTLRVEKFEPVPAESAA